jgi:hypothetical protein
MPLNSQCEHYIVSRWRQGWAVNVDADRLSEHLDLEEARETALMLAARALDDGRAAEFVDLSLAPPVARD